MTSERSPIDFVSGAGWRSIDLPHDLRCPACNTFDMVELRDLNQDADGYYPCDLCGGDGRMTPAALEVELGMERVPCLWCRGSGEAHGFMSSWCCPVCWGTGRMPA